MTADGALVLGAGAVAGVARGGSMPRSGSGGVTPRPGAAGAKLPWAAGVAGGVAGLAAPAGGSAFACSGPLAGCWAGSALPCPLGVVAWSVALAATAPPSSLGAAA